MKRKEKKAQNHEFPDPSKCVEVNETTNYVQIADGAPSRR